MSGQGLNYRLDYHNVFTSEQNFIFDEYVKSTFLKKFKKEKWTLGFIRYKFRMKRG